MGRFFIFYFFNQKRNNLSTVLLDGLWSFLIYICRLQVSGVAFDSYWSAPNTDGTGENIVYRFGSVGQVS